MSQKMLLDALLKMREDMRAGRIAMHLGEAKVELLEGFIAGYQACLGDQGMEDLQFEEFREWLRSERGEFPPEGWAAKYLRDCGGDESAAIQKFLDYVAEFAASKRGLGVS
jgi:hypothetical protein